MLKWYLDGIISKQKMDVYKSSGIQHDTRFEVFIPENIKNHPQNEATSKILRDAAIPIDYNRDVGWNGNSTESLVTRGK